MDFESVMTAALERRRRTRAHAMATIHIQGDTASATSPEGQSAQMPLADLLSKLGGHHMDLRGVILPDGVKTVLHQPPLLIWVWEAAPQPYNFHWIANNSPAPFGRGARYRSVRLGLPYLVMLAVFMIGPDGLWHLSSANECFFRNAPLKGLDDPLCYPALLNCSKFDPPEGRPLAWICTQHLRPSPAMGAPDLNTRLRAGLEALRHCLLETAFNWSSDHHEAASWFSESRTVDPRVSTVEAWEEASAKDPLFALEVPWLPTGLTLGQVGQRIFTNHQAGAGQGITAATLARIIFNQK